MFLTNHRIKGGGTVLTCRNNEMIFHENEGNLRKAHGMKGGCGLKVQTYFQSPVGEGMERKKNATEIISVALKYIHRWITNLHYVGR